MWKLNLPYAPDDTVYIATCTHMGHWGLETCKVSHYTVKSEVDVTVFMRQEENHGLRMCRLEEVFGTSEAAQSYIDAKQKEWGGKADL